MSIVKGEPFVAILNHGDASSGESVTSDEGGLFRSGSLTAVALAADEYLEVHSIQVVSAVGGAVHVFAGADNNAGAGETLVRGTVAANGGLVQELKPPHVCKAAHQVYAKAPVGAIDVVIRGGIRRQTVSGARASWKA